MTGAAPWYRASQRSNPTSSSPTGAHSSPAMDNAAWTISSRLIAGIVLYAGIGWLISLWWGNRPALIAIGAFVGQGLSYSPGWWECFPRRQQGGCDGRYFDRCEWT